jgi:phosphohistidine phosphatase
VLAELAKRVKRRRVALVGHEPDLGELAAALLGTPRALPFRKGGVCRIDVDRLGSSTTGSLIWFLPPKILRKTGR